MDFSDLKKFLTDKMNMTGIYQPVVIKELLLNDGQCTTDQLAKTFIAYDLSAMDHYRRVVMRWPKRTLTAHGIIRYEKSGGRFFLECAVPDDTEKKEAVELCESYIQSWVENKKDNEKSPVANASVRYRVLKTAKGKCVLCGIPSSLRPIDVDHIVPQSKAKKGKILRLGKLISVHSEENLQALCSKCNRAKRDADDTDFRRRESLIRDGELNNLAESRRMLGPLIGKKLIQALDDKLVEEHEEYIAQRDVEKLAGMMEVLFALAKEKGQHREGFLAMVEEKRAESGGYDKGFSIEVN
jgi:predicted house-cleaning noncanonical NTP pyrophosphatase (MazG superfamily)